MTSGVNDDAPEPELPVLDPTLMAEDEFELAEEAFKKRRTAVAYRKEQIQRWLAYQHSKVRNTSAGMEGTIDPYAILLSKLTGISLKKPHKPIAYNLWARENQKEVDLGMHMTLLAGGPEPGDGGRLNVISCHSGTTLGDVKMNFGRAERTGFKQHVLPLFGSYLKKSFTVDECRATALSNDSSSLRVVGFGEDGEGQVDPAVTPPAPASVTAVLPSFTLPPIAPRGLPPTLAQDDVTSGLRGPPSCPSSPNSPLLPSQEVSPVRSILPSIPPSREVSPVHSVPPSMPPSRVVSPTLSPSKQPPVRSASPSHVVSPISPPEQLPMPIQSPPDQRPAVATALSSDHPGPTSNALIDIVAVGRNHGVRAKARLSERSGAVRDQTKRKGVDIQGEEQSAKRRRKGGPGEGAAASTSYPATAIIPPLSCLPSLSSHLPDNTPPWVATAVKFLQSNVPSNVPGEDWTALGVKWSDAVLMWLSVEIKAGFAATTKLGMLKRPSCISDWIQRARIPTYPPNILDLHKFESDFLAWWTSLQPKWRHHGSKLL
ncbi:hypothetical protein K443DRAFT_15828 [Laccaria amethystina LaAM-08-1]|uniref:Uncharacterized protein n=1 Tax=Laccaria amethystina LaAM-08-1 TaxID=1095629 RepID=A0A0C9WKT8_9AGAR|nr:hypothetical protein K443DRAFT_15828 [Laccaria amethystina LaAM-08-1]